MKELETLLRSWRPRPPSSGVKRALFGAGLSVEYAAAACGEAVAPVPFRLGWLAPATVALLLGCVLFNQHNAFVLGQTASGGSLVAAAVSNQSVAPWLPGSFQRSHNSLPVDAFEWTSGGRRASNGGFALGVGRTN
jgi:hypothetical protein